jgi:hypothetical protein
VNARTLSLLVLAALPCTGGAVWTQSNLQAGPSLPPATAMPPAGPAAPCEPAWTAAERDAIECLRSLRQKERASDAELAARLSRAGDAILPFLFRVLAARAVPALADGEPQVLSEVQEHALLLAVGQLEREPVLAHVAACVPPGSEPRMRHAGLGCVGAVGRANDLMQLFQLALEPAETELDQRLAAALRRAVAAVVARDARTVEQLVSLRRVTRTELLPVLVEAVGASREARGLAYLSDVAYWHDELILSIMSQVPLLGPSGDEMIDGEMRVRLRTQLDESQPGHCRAAITALTALEDEQAIGPLITLLDSESTGLRDNAHWALRQLTGLALAPESGVWSRWHQGELYWQVRQKPREFQRLRDKDPAVAADALRTILTHPLARKELASALPDLLKSRHAALRVLACNTLASLRARESIGKLVWALEDANPEVAQAAHAALRTLTKLDLPCEPLAWQSATDTEPRGAEL